MQSFCEISKKSRIVGLCRSFLDLHDALTPTFLKLVTIPV